MQKITRETIRQLASSETVYYRGMRYYAAHAVSKVTWSESNKQYRAIVKGSNQYVVTIQADDQGEIVYNCNCPAHVKYTGACKHVVATLLFITDYQQRQEVKENLNAEDKMAYQIVEYFSKREYRHLSPQYFHIALQIHIADFLKEQDAKAYLSLYAGSGKMYKVSNTKKFVSDYYHKKKITLGKEFCFMPGECAFDEQSVPVLDYLTEILEVQETLGKTYYSNLFNRQEMVLSRNMLYKVLHLAAGMTCNLNLYGKKIENVQIVEGNPQIGLNLRMEQDSLFVENNNEQKLLSLCEDGSILYYEECLYLPKKDFICNILPIYTALFSNETKTIEFRNENKNGFIEKVLPVIKKSMQLTVPLELNNNYIVEPLVPKLYLDIVRSKTKIYVSARIHFVYGEYEVDPLHPFSSGKYILVRDKEEEERLTRLLYNLNFKVTDDAFLLKKEEDIFLLMTDKMNLLTENFEVFYSKAYKSASVKKFGYLSGKVRLDTEIDFLEMDLEYSQIPKEELVDFFKALRLKKRYYRLKSGAFIDLQEQNNHLKSLSWIVENGTVAEDGSIEMPKTMALYLDDFLPRTHKIEKEESYRKLVNDIHSPEQTNWKIPEGVNAVLRPYQVVGYQWLKTLAYYNMGGILADDMGLGKTLQAIVYICSNPGEKTLVVCPTSLAYNWQEEFEKFSPTIRTRVVSGNPQERMELIHDIEDVDVLITTYPLIRKDMEAYQDIVFDTIFIDEAQFIKNPSSLGAKAVKAIKAKHRFALTGTPIENALSELWSIFDFIMPGFFPRYSKFSELYEKPIMRGEDERVMQELKLRIKPFILRRMKKQVLRELPDKIETMRMAEMTKKQEKIYLSYLSRIQSEIRENEDFGSGAGRIQILAALTRLRQICCHPGTFVENYHSGSGKLDLLMEQLPDILDGGHSVIIFSQFTSMLSIIAKELEHAGIAYFYLAGSTKAIDRKKYVKEFNEGRVKVFLVSLKAGGTGLNLTGADTVIHFDPWWNPAVEEQATDRAYRIGQRRKVQVIRYVMKNSIEEKIYKLQKKKKELSNHVIDTGEVFINQLTKEELFDLFEEEE